VAHVCQDFLNQNHIHVLPWSALSPDLSPIEHWWDELSRRVCHRHRSRISSLYFMAFNVPCTILSWVHHDKFQSRP
jgi:transposase